MSGSVCRLLSITALLVAVCLPAGPARSDDDVRVWQMNSLLHPKLFGESAAHFADRLAELSGGRFVIEVHDRMVLDQDTFGALDAGLVDAVWGTAGHHHREDPALTIFGGFPFGPDPAGFTAWMRKGGGAKALDAIYARHGLKSLYCGALPAEGGGWFAAPLAGLEDLDGLRMRAFGYGARVLRKLGAVPLELPAGEIRPAFETGLIDAAEFAMPSIDSEIGVAEVAAHLYFPGWQQPATPLEILMPLRSWAALSEPDRAVIEAACNDTLAWTASEAVAQQIDALAEFREAGIELHTWPGATLDALRRAWDEVIDEETARDPLLAEAWQGYLEFRDGYDDWQARAYAE